MNIIKNYEIHKSLYIFLVNCLFALTILLLCSYVKINLWVVPFTMQTFAIFLVGYLFDRKIIIASILLSFIFLDNNLYTIGYKIGFILSGLFINHYKNRIDNQIILFILASLIIFISGVFYLGLYIGDIREALYIGFLPFIIPDIFKINAASVVIKLIRSPKS